MKAVRRLDALTSLRFVAASMIVILHLKGSFGVPKYFLVGLPLAQGVSFFFVLSGFILTYVHPVLRSTEERLRFLLARVARIWPGHAFSILCIVLLLPSQLHDHGAALTLLTLSMVQSWVPVQWSFYAFNGPAWSISTEFFFYVCFPFLIYRWEKTWALKVMLVVAVAATILFAVNYFQVPVRVEDRHKMSLLGLVYINPLIRLVEFVFGMCLALLLARSAPRIKLEPIAGTILEIATFAIVTCSMLYLPRLEPQLQQIDFLGFGEAGRTIFEVCNGAPAFGLLIFVISLECGFASRLLKWRVAVFLGEISYSIYLFHEVVMRVISYHWPAVAKSDSPWAAVDFTILLLVAAYLSWRFVERPMRWTIVGLWADPRKPNKAIRADHVNESRSLRVQLLAGLGGLMLIAGVVVQLQLTTAAARSAETARLATAPAVMQGNLIGAWNALGGQASISLDADGGLTIRNEQGMTATGQVRGDVLQAPVWLATAHLSADGQVLTWSNGAIWNRVHQ